MPTNEKEINNYLFDQLAMLRRIERRVDKGEDVHEAIADERHDIELKLYQKPPLVSE